jgi:hypothetical protein
MARVHYVEQLFRVLNALGPTYGSVGKDSHSPFAKIWDGST